MFGKKHAAESGKKKYLYMFEEGNKDMRELLGGKGANLAEMTNAGMPVPPGFTITTEACTQYYTDGRQINKDIMADIFVYLEKLEKKVGKKFGDVESPLLVSVRSGARASMPGMMDTILSGPERRIRTGPRQADQQPPLCLRQLSPFHPDVLRCCYGAFQEALRGDH